MTTIVDFLARMLDEDEAAMAELGSVDFTAAGQNGAALDGWAKRMSARVLREVAAKRAVVAEHFVIVQTYWPSPTCVVCGDRDAESMPDPLGSPALWTPNATYPCPTLRHLAAIYRDEPGYDERWAVV